MAAAVATTAGNVDSFPPAWAPSRGVGPSSIPVSTGEGRRPRASTSTEGLAYPHGLRDDLGMSSLQVFSTGGTIDKIYFDANSEFEVGSPQVPVLLREVGYPLDYAFESLLSKDSLDLTDDDRRRIAEAVRTTPARRVVITHGTDTMIETARRLQGISNKTIVLTGALQPARFKTSDATFNLGGAITAAGLLAPGVYIAIQGQVFDPDRTRKNREKQRFEVTE